MQFTYTAKAKDGQSASGVLAADSLPQAQQQLRQQGLFVVSLTPARGGRRGTADAKRGTVASRLPSPAPRSPRRRRVARKDLLAFTSQLAIMSKAGIDVAGAIQSLKKQAQSTALKATLDAVYQDVIGGTAFSVALGKHVEVFGQAYVASVAAGEASGRLSDVLGRLAAIQRNELRLRTTRRAMLAYPIVLSVVAGIVILGLMFFVLPQFTGVFAQFDMKLPALTQFLLAVSGEMRARWWLWIGLAAAAVAAAVAFRSHPAVRRALDRFVLHAAGIRDVTRALLTGRSFRLLGIMIESGVPLVEGLRLTRSSIGNSVFRGLFETLEHDVLNGRGLSEALAAATFVPGGAAEMVATAERTGTLGTVAEVIGEYYEEEGETRMRELTTMIEPLIIVVMGVVVACMVMAVMLPMFDFATLAQQGG